MKSLFCGIALVGLLATLSYGQAPRPLTTGQRITAEANAKRALRTEVQAEVRRQQQHQRDLRSYGAQDFYRGPKGDVVNSRDLPANFRANGYHFTGSRDFGSRHAWSPPNRSR
jgi:hypothetical protein